MPRRTLSTPNAPASPLFSQAVQAGPFLYLSGTAGTDPVTGRLAGADIQAQTRQAMTNCQAILAAGGEPPTRHVARLGANIAGLLVSIRMTAFLG